MALFGSQKHLLASENLYGCISVKFFLWMQIKEGHGDRFNLIYFNMKYINISFCMFLYAPMLEYDGLLMRGAEFLALIS